MVGIGTASVVVPTSAVLTRACMLSLPSELEPSESTSQPPQNSLRVVSRNGEPLAHLRTGDGKRHVQLPLADFGDKLPAALIAAEDRRFYQHHGVDVLATGRAVLTSLAARRVMSGASTLSQQLARTVTKAPRTLRSKFDVIALSLRIEQELSKEQILEAYLNRVEFGPNIEGAEAGALHYFGKRARQLSWAEAAALASLPRGPSLYDPRKGTEKLLRRRNRVLDRMASNGSLSESEAASAKLEPIRIASPAQLGSAPHFVNALLQGPDLCSSAPQGRDSFPADAAVIHTTLDGDLEAEIEESTRRIVASVKDKSISAASVVVLDNMNGDVLAYVGSPDSSDQKSLGANDGVRALRQPGSSLKPFVYGVGLESGLDANALLPDVELSFAAGEGDFFRPQNYDRLFHGPVTMREALGNSFNVPAVWVAERVTPQAIKSRLMSLGFCSLDQPAEHYGVGIALGDGEVSLLELAVAYSALARGGERLPPRFITAFENGEGEREEQAVAAPFARSFERETVAVLTDMLADRRARRSSFGERTVFDLPMPVAAKTGTSKGYRDNVAVGFSTRVTVAVWVGNFDGSPMKGISGITGAGPLFREAMLAAERRYPSAGAFESPQEHELREVCALSGAPVGPYCSGHKQEWIADGSSEGTCTVHVQLPVDPTNSLLAGPDCKDAEPRIFERFPPLFHAWAEAAKRPLIPGPSARCPPSSSQDKRSRAVVILYPEDGARFYLEQGRQSQIRVRAAFGAAAAPGFLLDGRPLRADQVGTALITLTRGVHQLRPTMDSLVVGDATEFVVE